MNHRRLRRDGWSAVNFKIPSWVEQQDPGFKGFATREDMVNWAKENVPEGEWHYVFVGGSSKLTRTMLFKDEAFVPWFRMQFGIF